MSENSTQPENKAEVKDTSKNSDNLVNGIVLEFSIQKQVSDTDIAILNLPQNMHPKKAEVPTEQTNNLIPISSVLDKLEEQAHVNVDLIVLEAQIKTITTFVTEAKVLEIEMNKLIKGIFAKSPELKPYLLRMKKLLQDHANIEKALEATKNHPKSEDDKKVS